MYCTRIVGIDSVEGTSGDSPVHVPTEPTCNQDEGKTTCQQYVNSMSTICKQHVYSTSVNVTKYVYTYYVNVHVYLPT